AVGVLEEFFRWAPVVPHGDERRAFVEVEIKPMLRVGHEWAGLHVGNGIFSDDRAGLRGQKVNPTEVAKPLADVMNVIRINIIIAQGVGHFRPAPTDTDARVRQVENFVVLDGNVPRITDTNADAAPVFITTV